MGGPPERARNLYHLLPLSASSRAVIRSHRDSAGLAVDPADFADSAAVAVSVSELVSDLVDDLPSLALLAGAVLYSLDLGSSACLLLACLSCFLVSFFLDETVLAFLTSCSFLYLACPAVPRILYKPVEMQVRLRISM